MKRKDTFYSWRGGGGVEGMKSREEKKDKEECITSKIGREESSSKSEPS